MKKSSETILIDSLERLSIKKKDDKNNSKNLIDTLNNLNYETLKQILFILNLPECEYMKYAKTLDDFVSKRHDIAHGHPNIYFDTLKLTYEEISLYKQLVIDLIIQFTRDLEDSLEAIEYKK